MQFEWTDFDPTAHVFVETWLDDHAIRMTGIDDGWTPYVDWLLTDSESRPGENCWCKVISQNNTPFAAVCLYFTDERCLNVSEYLVAPTHRGKGLGTAALRELLTHTEDLLGITVDCAEAVIFPNNPASKHAFENAGFRYRSTHPDGDADYYIYTP